MKSLKLHFPIVLLAILEIVIGVLLLVNGGLFMRWVIIAFGVVMLAVGVYNLIRYIKTKNTEEKSAYRLIYAIEALLVGIGSIVLSGFIALKDTKKTYVIFAVIFGVIFVILGFYKMQLISEIKKMKAKTSFLAVINVFLSVIVGAAVILLSIFYKGITQQFVFVYSAVGFFLLALVDLIAAVHAAAISGKAEAEEKDADRDEEDGEK